MGSTVWKTVQRALINSGIDTYPPATKTGDCKTFYTVLKQGGSSRYPGLSSELHYYDLLCYAPKERYTELLDFVADCKAVMSCSPVFPMLMPTGTETPPYFDDSINGYVASVQYRNNVKNDHL